MFKFDFIKNPTLGFSFSFVFSVFLVASISGCKSEPDFSCPESMASEEYSLVVLDKIDLIQDLETRLDKIGSHCRVPPENKDAYEALVLKVARKGTPEQAMWLYEKIQSYPESFIKKFLIESRFFGIASPVAQGEEGKFVLVDPKNVGEEVKSAQISSEHAALAKTKYIEGMYDDNPDESRRIVRIGSRRAPVLMQRSDQGSNGSSLIEVRFDSLVSGKEVPLRTSGTDVSEWTPASEHRAAGGYHQGRYKFITNQSGDIKYAVEVLVSADYSLYASRGEEPPETTPCNISTRVLEFSESGFEYRRVLDSSVDTECATNLEPTKSNQKTADNVFDAAFESAYKNIKSYRPIPYVAKYINLSRGNEIDKLLVAQLREIGRAGRLQLLGAIYAANTLPKKEDFENSAEYTLAKFKSAASLVKDVREVFSGVEYILRAVPAELTDRVELYSNLVPEINENKPSEDSVAKEYSYMAFFVNREISVNNGPGHGVFYEAYRVSDRKPFVVFSGRPVFSGQGVFPLYGKLLGSTVSFQSGLSGFSVEAPVIEMASPEVVDQIKMDVKKLSRYRQLTSKLEQSGSELAAIVNAAHGNITEAIVRR